MHYTKPLMKKLALSQSNERNFNIQPRPDFLKEKLEVQHLVKQTFKREKSQQLEKYSRQP